MRDTNKLSFFKSASHSLIGHVVLFQMFCSVPMFVLFLGTMYFDGVLTLVWTLKALLLTFLGGLVVAILFWYTVSRPLIKRRNKGH